jgi:glycosyltransferase involved in cell wall biosynthesis
LLGADDPFARAPGGWQTIVSTLLERTSKPERYAIAAPNGGPPGWTSRSLGTRTFDVYVLGERRPLLRSHRLGAVLLVIRSVRRLRRFRVIYSHGPELLVPFVLAGYRGRLVLYVVGDIGAEVGHARHAALRPLARMYVAFSFWLMKRCAKVIWVDATQLDGLPRSIAERSDVLATAYDPEVFTPAPEPPTREPVRLVSVSRLTLLKRVDITLRALALAAADGRDWRLTVCGSGEDEERLRALAYELGVADRVDWRTQHLSREELAAAIRSSHVGILVSASEGSPTVVKEFLGSGLAVVVSNVGDNRTLVRDGVNGVLLEKVDPSSVYAGVDRALALPNAPAEAVASVAPFVVDTWVERLESLLA